MAAGREPLQGLGYVHLWMIRHTDAFFSAMIRLSFTPHFISGMIDVACGDLRTR